MTADRSSSATEPLHHSNLDDHDDEDDWIPLVADEEPSLSGTQQTASASVSLVRTGAPISATNSITQRESLKSIHQRLESRARLRKGLIEHPLNRFCGRLVIHLANELWRDPSVRLGLMLVGIGATLQVFWFLSYSFSCWYHPRIIFLAFVLCLSYVYVSRKDVEKQIDAVLVYLANPSAMTDTAIQILEQLQLRWVFLFLLLTPTFLEARTLAFLSATLVESGWICNLATSLVVLTWMLYQNRFANMRPRDCTMQGMLVLYGFALLAAVTRFDIGRVPALGGPFFLATGAMLLTRRQNDDHNNDDSRFSRALRHALRLTLRDVLSTVGESVREDEMLQLAMLRWIVDYWSYTPTDAHSASDTPPSSASADDLHQQAGAGNAATDQRLESSGTHHELEWYELCSMLTMTTDQMVEEVHAPPLHEGTSAEHQQSQTAHFPDDSETNGSLDNLKSMLASMDVDERAKPAVLSYKRAVESFPPSRRVAECLALLQRCPAALTVSCRYLLGSQLAIPTTITLLPFIAFEVIRIRDWSQACRRAFPNDATPDNDVSTASPLSSLESLPKDMDPMCILLSGDHHSAYRPSSLLQVWANVCSSVTALETGLTAARCVQTTAVAAEFAGNVMSLAEFGMEVSKKGWLHGVAILARELIHIHSTAGQSATRQTGTNNARYSSAAVNAVKNSQIVAHNVGVLLEENGGNPIVDPVVGVLSALVGRGWLWGKEESLDSAAKTTRTDSDDRDERQSTEETVNGIDSTSQRVEGDEPLHHDGTDTDSKRYDVNKTSLQKATGHAEVASAPDDAVSLQEVAPTEETTEGEQDLSHVLELIADASERRLITEDEKNAFMETMVVSRANCDSGASARHEGPSVDVIRKSLECLLEETALQSEHQVETETITASAAPNCNREESEDDRVGNESRLVSFMANNNSAANTASQLEHSTDRNEEHAVRTQLLQDPLGDVPGSNSVGSCTGTDGSCLDSRAENRDGTESSTKTAYSPEDPSNAAPEDDRREMRIATGASLVADAPSVNTSVDRCDAQDSRSEPRGADNDDNWVKSVGIGLAVVGAVVGGMAVTSGLNQPRQRQRSTVTIEEIVDDDDDEDENDEWESVSPSNVQ